MNDDDVKLRSCLTLLPEIDGADGVFARAPSTYFDDEPDPATLVLLANPR